MTKQPTFEPSCGFELKRTTSILKQAKWNNQ